MCRVSLDLILVALFVCSSSVPFHRDVLKQEFYQRVAGSVNDSQRIVYSAEHKPAGKKDDLTPNVKHIIPYLASPTFLPNI